MIIFFDHTKWDVIAVLVVYASQLVVFIYNHSGGDNFGVSSCRCTLCGQRANNNNLPEMSDLSDDFREHWCPIVLQGHPSNFKVAQL